MNEETAMNAPMNLAQVIPTWMQAKEDERKAIEHRRQLDELIKSLLPTKEEGSVTATEGYYKVSVSYKLDRKLDTAALQLDWAKLPAKAAEAIKWKADLSMSVFRTLSDTDKAALSGYVTTKPATPTVSVEIKE